MRSILWVALVLFFPPGVVDGEQRGAPPDLYVSKGACPFECCTYREWTAKRDIPVLDRPGGKPIAQLRKQDRVTAVTGEVRTHPVRFQLASAAADSEGVAIPAGAIAYLLHPVGEGVWSVWYRGKAIEIDPGNVARVPSYEWWAKIKLSSGQFGWVSMTFRDLPFDQVDSCG